jgi:hypothetical protein
LNLKGRSLSDKPPPRRVSPRDLFRNSFLVDKSEHPWFKVVQPFVRSEVLAGLVGKARQGIKPKGIGFEIEFADEPRPKSGEVSIVDPTLVNRVLDPGGIAHADGGGAAEPLSARRVGGGDVVANQPRAAIFHARNPK